MTVARILAFFLNLFDEDFSEGEDDLRAPSDQGYVYRWSST